MASETGDKLLKYIQRAEEHAGTVLARQAVKLIPLEWHLVCEVGREAAAALSQAEAREAEMQEALREITEADAQNTGAEPSQSVFDMAIDRARRLLDGRQ